LEEAGELLASRRGRPGYTERNPRGFDMTALIDLVRAANPRERVALFAELSREALAGADGPVAVVDEQSRTVGYLTAEVNAASTLPTRTLSPEYLAELRRRAEHPEESVPADEFIRQIEADIAARPGR